MDGPRFRVGLDIGGTFTDVAVHDVMTGELTLWKELSTREDPSLGALAAVRGSLERAGGSLADVSQIVHGTTVGANIVVERTGAKTALLTTDGFADILAIQRQVRHSPYDLYFSRHEPLVPRELVFSVPERLAFDGAVVTSLDEEALAAIAADLRGAGVEAVAVTLLHSYVNPAHERLVGEILARELPEVSISLSCDVASQIREYERASTTVLNAYIRPAFERYLEHLDQLLRREGFTGGLYLMQANGGLASAKTTASTPVRALESGPAAGVMMSTYYADDGEDILAFEMGGTTAKACLVEGNRPRIVGAFEVDRTLMRQGTGLPVLIPAIDLVEIGAGGGSLAHAAFGTVHVGPRSAGAEPGPACYGRGGDHATVTDANLVLGYLNPEFFNEGRLALVTDASRGAVASDIADPLGMTLEDAAWGIYDAATANMESAARAVSTERGVDPRGLTLVAGGGAGPLHACRLARALSIPRVVVPREAGVLAAVGLLRADPRFDLIQSVVARLEHDLSGLGDAFESLRERARELLDETALHGSRSLSYSVDMRYHGQGHVIEVALPDRGELSGPRLRELFEARYTVLFGQADPEATPEITSLRLSAEIQAPRFDFRDSAPKQVTHSPVRVRTAYFPEAGGAIACDVYRRTDLGAGQEISGPAIIEDAGSTTILLPGDRAQVDDHQTLHIDVALGARETVAEPGAVDPLTLGTVWRALLSIANDSGTALQRTAYSEAVREGRDFSTAVFDRHARLVAQGDFSPGHLGSMPDVVRHVLSYYPPDTLAPGDAILLNDPWLGSGHLPDFLLTVPIFLRDELIGFAVSCVHMIDVGGAAPGSQAVNGITDVFQEGLRILPTRIWTSAGANEEFLRLLSANVRVPTKLIGDLKAMRSAGRVAEQRLSQLVDRVGAATFDAVCDALLAQSEEAMRDSLRRLPDCELSAVDFLDDAGPDTKELKIAATVTISGGDLTIDFRGSSGQTKSGINAVANYTRAYSYFAAKVLLHGPDLPQNAGSIAPVRWTAPERTVVNAAPFVGVGARAIMQQRIVDVLMQAFASALPRRVLAPSSHWANPIVGGTDPRTGAQFVFYEIVVGGFGGRAGSDGIEAMCPSFNIDGIPVEVNEHAYPVLVERYEIVPDSAGAGRWRGGHGIRKHVRFGGADMRLSNLAERHRFHPPGLFGGEPGAMGATFLRRAGHDDQPLHGKGSYELESGDMLICILSGGGGYGDPRDRDPDAVGLDVRYGWLSPERARTAYGVVIDPQGHVDIDATHALRNRMAPKDPDSRSVSTGNVSRA